MMTFVMMNLDRSVEKNMKENDQDKADGMKQEVEMSDL